MEDLGSPLDETLARKTLRSTHRSSAEIVPGDLDSTMSPALSLFRQSKM